MRKITSLVSVLVFALVAVPVFAQSTVPDVSSSGWAAVGEERADLVENFDGKHTVTTYVALAKSYVNDSNGMAAKVLTWDGNEVAMMFGKMDDQGPPRFAIKVNGKWHVAKQAGTPPNISVVTGPNRVPVGIQLSLETVDGPKEIVLKLS